MAESFAERTEKPTPRRIAEAQSRGQFARTAEIQTVVVLAAGFGAIALTGHQMAQIIMTSTVDTWGQLGRVPISTTSIQAVLGNFTRWLLLCVGPVMAAATIAGILAGIAQSRFHLSMERLGFNWERLNPVQNVQQFFSPGPSIMRTLIGFLKFLVILGFTYLVIKRLLGHPIFHSATSFREVILFIIEAVRSVTLRVLAGLAVIALVDYGYQYWKTQRELMMTKEEVKEETKNAEGNPQVKSEFRRRRFSMLRQNWLKEIPKADVVVTNPTHLSVALRYDRKTMRAPKVIAKGARLNALRIREIAGEFQIPIIENKPVAQFLYKNCKSGQEVPAEVYAAVAEILAYVYRTNRFRYYSEGRHVPA